MNEEGQHEVRARRRFHLALAVVCFLAGVGTLFYHGPGRAILRGHVGDVLVVAFLYFLWGALLPTSRRIRWLGVGGFALGVEFLQLFNLVAPDAAPWLILTLGTTFDFADLLAYAIGLGGAVAMDKWWER